jgi:hypothetical protein
VLGGWLYQLDKIAVSVLYVQAGRFEERRDIWHPHSRTSAKRFLVADFMYRRRGEPPDEGDEATPAAIASTGP